MRYAPLALALALALAGCAADPVIVSHTPASVELKCENMLGGCRSAQAVADAAQAHCRQYGLDAQLASSQASASGNRWASYKCVQPASPAR